LQTHGTTAQREILTLRREKAETELQDTTRTIGAIATRLGYSDLAVFSRAFKRWTGMSPSHFRKTSQR
jgi:AraC-like DNA-binding protein